MRRGASFRVVAGWLILGLVFGSTGTLLTLKMSGISLIPGTSSAAFQKFYAAYHDLHDKYLTTESDATLLNGAISGMTNSLGDPFTDYFNPTAAKQFNQMLSSSFVGIGVTIEQTHAGVEIMSVIAASPAKQSGLQAHDVIEQVNGTQTEHLTIQQVSNLVVGPAGSSVTLTIHRPGAGGLLTFTMKRAKVNKPSVLTKMVGHNVGYMQISVVAQNTATEVQQGLSDLRKEGMKSLVLDVRGNPGGYLTVAVDIASDFVPKGKVVVETQNRAGHIQQIKSKGPGSSLPVVVIMDKNTASAAEILSGALNEDDGVQLVGTKSFGKGTVQITQSYSDGSSLKFTIDKWLTPNGSWIHKKGLTPTTAVSLPDYVNLASISSGALPISRGQNNTAVQTLQQTLKALGFTVARTDGYFDASTEQAVKQLQQAAGLKVTGTVDSATASAVDSRFAVLLAKSDTQLQKAEQIAINLQKAH